MSRRLDAFAPFSARLCSLVHVVTNSDNGALFFYSKTTGISRWGSRSKRTKNNDPSLHGQG